MSAIQLRWLNNHFLQGKINKEEFKSLYLVIKNSEARAEQAKQEYTSQTQTARTDGAVRTVPRLHPITRRMLAQVRVFKAVAKSAKYILVLAIISMIYLVAEHYQNNGSLPSLTFNSIEQLVIQSLQKPLPEDIVQAAEYLTLQSEWSHQHIDQFMAKWQALSKVERIKYQKSHWYRSLSLALSLQITEQRTLAKQGDVNAIRRVEKLAALANKIERKPA